MNTYPEHEKIKALGSDNQTAGEFLDWLRSDKGYTLCKWREEVRMELSGGHFDVTPAGYRSCYKSTEKLLYDFFGIDYGKIQIEKDVMLTELREQGE